MSENDLKKICVSGYGKIAKAGDTWNLILARVLHGP
jgi:hypothetical protein